MLRSLQALLVVLAALAVCCGSDDLVAPNAPVAPQTATVTLDFVLARNVPSNVTEFEFVGTDTRGLEVFRERRPKAARIVLTVPVSLKNLTILFLADGVQAGAAVVAVDLVPGQNLLIEDPDRGTPTYQVLKQDILINADMWELQPRMIAAGLGFTDIIGVSGLDETRPEMSERLARAAGGTWNLLTGATPNLRAYTSAITPQQVATTYGWPVLGCGGLPVEFSWPVRPSTLDATDFLITLNDGSSVIPEVTSISPNFDFNERAVAVLFGKFGNRFGPGDPRARFPVRIEVVGDDTPLQLVGPGGQFVSAVGMGADAPGTPYTDPDVPPEQRGGPRLVGAKLTRMSARGDQSPTLFAQASPNDGVTLYGDQAQYRLRLYTSGGFSPDGVRSMYPTEYQRYFRVQATTASGATVLLTEAGVDYLVDGARVRVVGLAELGQPMAVYDDTYVEDHDNQIDIVLAGDEAAMRKITRVEVPSVAPYSPLYNPGGPGNKPTPGVRYSAPSRPHTQVVLQALDDPLTVDLIPPGFESARTGQRAGL
jgi:hypothetical protein